MKAKDLAKKLGVSPATISLVLNNKPGISDSLRKSLVEKIQELGHEEMLCQSCREGEVPGSKPAPVQRPAGAGCACKVIAYLIFEDREYVEDIKDPYNFFSGVLEGIEAEAWENDCCLVMVHMNRHKNIRLSEQLRRTGNVIGAIAHSANLTDETIRRIQEIDVPCVFTDTFGIRGWEPPSVCISNRQGMEGVVRYLAAKGHTNIGYFYSGWEHPVQVDRRRCYQQALRDLGLADRPENYFCTGPDAEIFDYQKTAELFRQAEVLPTAIVCENDRQAWRAVKALKQIGKKVPEDVSITGFDDQPICTLVDPPITSVHNSPQLMGRQCVTMIQNLWRLRELGEPDPWLRYELPARLVERGSVRDLNEE